MTKIGRLLVYANLFISVALFSWAAALYSNQPLWLDRDLGEGGKVEGQLTQLNNEVKRLNEACKTAQISYARASATATARENERDFRKAVLDRWMLEVTDQNNINALFRVIPRARETGLIDVRAQQLAPQMGLSNKPLRGLGAMQRDMTNAINEEKATVIAIKDVRNKILELTELIDRQYIEAVAQKTIKNNLTDQEVFLADKQIDWDEQLRTLSLRKTQLESRISEFKK